MGRKTALYPHYFLRCVLREINLTIVFTVPLSFCREVYTFKLSRSAKNLHTDFYSLVGSTLENLPLNQAVVGSVIVKLYQCSLLFVAYLFSSKRKNFSRALCRGWSF